MRPNKLRWASPAGLRVAAALFMLAGLVKLALVVGGSPVMGYANNWDFARLQSCVGLWPKYVGKSKEVSNPEAPIRSYVLDRDKKPDLCVASTDLGILKLALFQIRRGQEFDIRRMGATRVAVVLILLAGLLTTVRRSGYVLFLGISVLLVFGDVAFSLYFDTLYTEFSVIAGLFFSIAAVSALANPQRPGPGPYLVLALGVGGLAFSKEQYSFLAPVFLVLAAFLLWKVQRRTMTSILVCGLALILPFLASALAKRDSPFGQTVALANKTDTFLAAVLPSASDVPRALRILGLPESCSGAVGKSWYSEGVQANHPCPELRDTGRLRLIPLFATQPRTLFRPLWGAVRLSRPWMLNHLGKLETGLAPESLAFRALSVTSLSGLVEVLPDRVYAAVLLGLVMLAGLSGALVLAALGTSIPVAGGAAVRRRADLLLAIACGGGVAVYALVSSVFGDGYFELAKHAVGLGVGLLMELAALVALLVVSLVEAPGPESSAPGAARDWVASPRDRHQARPGAAGARPCLSRDL